MKKALLIIIALSGLLAPTQAQNPRHYLYSASIHGGWTLKTNMALENVPAYYTDYLETVKQGLRSLKRLSVLESLSMKPLTNTPQQRLTF